ncbi:MAG: dipeptidase [Acidobacteriota bacterium]
MRVVPAAVASAVVVGLAGSAWLPERGEDPTGDAVALAHELLILDTHVDLPYRLFQEWTDISGETAGEFDWPKARAGGLDAIFAAIYVPASLSAEQAFERADRLIDLVDGLAERWPDRFVRANRPEDVEAAFAAGKVALVLGMENGTPLGERGEHLDYLVKRGIRYVGMAHSRSNFLADASYDEERLWHGLSPLGRELVGRLNDRGVMIDLSHLSDEAALQVLELSRAPVIASHSSCRAFTPGWERNLSDELIRRIAAGGGVVQVNFGRMFLVDDYRRNRMEQVRRFRDFLRTRELEADAPEAVAFRRRLAGEFPLPRVTVADVADHVEHIVKLVGVDHVGFGSDYEGLDGDLPEGLENVSRYPALLAELRRRGFDREALEKIAGGNLLRVWREVRRRARN